MPFIHRSQIDPKTRTEQLAKYRRKLKEDLLNPALTQQQRAQIKKKLDQLTKTTRP
jgi:hypothetical protein